MWYCMNLFVCFLNNLVSFFLDVGRVGMEFSFIITAVAKVKHINHTNRQVMLKNWFTESRYESACICAEFWLKSLP